MKGRNIVIILIVTLSVCCNNREIKTTSAEVNKVRVTKISESFISIPVHSTGTLVSSEELKLLFKTGGIIAKINVKEGARVNKGDILASLDLSEINANAAQASSGYEKALRDYKRAENLFRDSVATLEQKENAATAMNVAKSTLNIVQFNLEHSKIIAPENGVILKQFARPNELVSSGYPVFLFGSSGKYWKVKAGLSDKDIVKINSGDSAMVSFDAYPGMKFPATVDQVGELSNPYTGTYEIEMLLGDSVPRLASGFVAGADIYPAAKSSFTMIPIGSLVEADGMQAYIYVVRDNMTVQKIRIEIETVIGSMVAIKNFPGGYKEIVSEGVAYLKDGMKVELIK